MIGVLERKGAVAFSSTAVQPECHRLRTYFCVLLPKGRLRAGLARAVHDFCTARDRGLAVSSGVWVPDLVEAKAPLGLAVLIRIACSVHVDWLCRPMIQQGTYTHTWVLGGIWYSLHCTRYIRDIRGSGLNGTVEVLWNEFDRSKMCERQLGRRRGGGGGVNDDSRPSTDKYLL